MERKVYIDPYPKTMKMLGLERINIDSGNNTSIVTPANIAKDMVALLPDEVFIPESKFLDICCKSGIFLTSIRERLMNSPVMIEAIPDYKERYEYITNNQLYGIAPNGQCQMYSVRAVYGTLKVDSPHILCFGAFNEYKSACLNNNHKLLIDEMKKEFNTMKFDIVIGNPPYNKGMDLDFVDLGYKLSNKYTVMITPAKWQTTDASHRVASKIGYEKFRDSYQKHMCHIVFYPCCKDVFDIYQPDGISFFLIDKSIHESCIVENRCNDISVFNSTVDRTLENRSSLLNSGNEIIEYLENYKRFMFPVLTGRKRYEVWTNTQPSGYDWYATVRPRYVLCPSRIICKCEGDWCEVAAAKPVFEADTIEECESFLSWINCKFTRFFLVPNISRLTGILTDDCFRFVPAPPSGKFDHIYTDQELYKAFNLPQKYIDIIEAVIKERK